MRQKFFDFLFGQWLRVLVLFQPVVKRVLTFPFAIVYHLLLLKRAMIFIDGSVMYTATSSRKIPISIRGNIIKIVLLILYFVNLFLSPVYGACTNEGTTWPDTGSPICTYTASTCSAANIQSALSSCADDANCTGVRIPPCKNNSNGDYWTGATDKVCVGMDHEYHVVGAGKDETVLRYMDSGTHGPGTGCYPVTFSPTSGNMMFEFHGSGFKELSNFTMVGNPNLYGLGSVRIHVSHAGHQANNWRVHHMGFHLAKGSPHSPQTDQYPGMVALFDHNQVGNAGSWGVLTASVAIDATEIPVTDASYFPLPSTSSNYIVIGCEGISCTGKTGNTLTGCTRRYKTDMCLASAYNVGQMAWPYNGNYGLTLTGNGGESQWITEPKFGAEMTGNGDAIFVEDNVFNGTYHPIAGFCDTRSVIRHNDFYRNMSSVESHEAGYTGHPCLTYPLPGPYSREFHDNTFHGGNYDADGDYKICAAGYFMRGGYHIVTDNRVSCPGKADTSGYAWNTTLTVALTSTPTQACASGGSPCTNDRTNCYSASGCPEAATGFETTMDCYHPLAASYVWNNDVTGTYGGQGFSKQGRLECQAENQAYFMRAPAIGDKKDVLGHTWSGSYTKYQYPHPFNRDGGGKSISFGAGSHSISIGGGSQSISW